jgi:hypothetical protein
MRIGKIVGLASNDGYEYDGQVSYIELDDDFLEFLVDAIRNTSPPGPKKPYEADFKDGLNSLIAFGKYKGRTWDAIKNTDPEYIQWVCEKVDRVPEEFKKLLRGEEQEF